MDIMSRFQVSGTMVANDFIDRYMASANGEYVKVYLYILRHEREQLELNTIADALNHTEADVRRALHYWEQLGVLQLGRGTAAGRRGGAPAETAASRMEAGQTGAAAAPGISLAGGSGAGGSRPRPTYSPEQVNRLNGDEDFSQLLYIAQKYMNKIFTQRECEVFAYLYDGLRMTADLLEYLVEYCVQGGHGSIRYIETVALSWHEKGIKTAQEAREYTASFTKDSFAVMRAFGLTDRKPGDAEKEMIERWFNGYGFGRELVVEACNRTMDAIHSPSFRYADTILDGWRKAGVRSIKDVAVLDEKRRKQRTGQTSRKPANQFHNFEQRNTDYDSMVLDQVKTWIGD